MSSVLRRLPLSRLLLLCGTVSVVGAGAAALALAMGGGPVPAPKPLAQAVHDALNAPPVEGVSARIQFTNNLIEGASLANSGGEASQLASSPLISGSSGRLWIGSNGHARLELQSEKGDMQVLWDGHAASLYDAATNTLYRYVPPTHEAQTGEGTDAKEGKVPTVAEIQEGLDKAGKHAQISEATPTDIAEQAAYTVRVAPREDGGLIAGGELSWDAVHGVPLRFAVFSTTTPAPVLELAATEISYGPVDTSTLDFTPPSSAHVKNVTAPSHPSGSSDEGASSNKPHVTVHGKGLGAIVLAESPVKGGEANGESSLEGTRKVNIDGTSASELPTALGTILTFERTGVRYLLAGSVTASAIETFAKGL